MGASGVAAAGPYLQECSALVLVTVVEAAHDDMLLIAVARDERVAAAGVGISPSLDDLTEALSGKSFIVDALDVLPVPDLVAEQGPAISTNDIGHWRFFR
jgi:hypothetical protein